MEQPRKPSKKRLKREEREPTDEELAFEEFLSDRPDISVISEKELASLLAEALTEAAKNKKYTRDCRHALAAVIDEFASSYILIGFDVSGEPIEILCAKSSMEADALGMFLQKFVNRYFTKYNPPG